MAKPPKSAADIPGAIAYGFDKIFGGIGQSDYNAGLPGTTANYSYSNPANQTFDYGGTTMAPEHDLVRNEVFFAPDRTAPQAGGVQLGYVPPAPQAQLNTGLMDPGNAVVGGGLGVTGAGLQNAEGTRAFQTANLLGLGAAAAGAVPSAAEAQLNRGLDAGLKQNLALAASARGTAANQAEARRNAVDANTGAVLQTGGVAAQLRAQEQAAARQQLTDALTGIRQGDLATAGVGLGAAGVGVQQAGQGLQAATAQLGSDTQTGIANLQSATSNAQAQLGADQAVQLANLDAKLRQQGMDDQKRIAYLGQLMGLDTSTADGWARANELLVNAGLQVQRINAGISESNAAVGPQILGAGLAAGGAVAGSAVGR